MNDHAPASAPPRAMAIVGRPNVGKSALFNRLVGRRVSIVHEESGVTRDRVVCRTRWQDRSFDLIDTGGIGMIDEHSSPDAIEHGTRTQVDVAIQDAAVLVFVVDISAGVVPLDQEVARLLHVCGRPVILAANKADTGARDGDAADFEQLGFPVVPISALHNRGIEDLMNLAAGKLPQAETDEDVKPLRVAIVGRPNVGKSSFINRLLNSERVIVSSVPGTTRDSIEIPFSVGRGPSAQHYVLVDTAGIKKQGRVKSPVETFSMMRTENAVKDCDVAVLVVDAEEGPMARDKKIAGMIAEYEKGCILLVNKWDLAEGTVTQRAYGKGLQAALPFMGYVPTLFASAKSGYNVRRVMDAIDYVGTQVRKELSTGVLNRILHEAFDRVSPPNVGGRRMKFYYAAQVGTLPVRLRLFVNDAKLAKPQYKAYLDRILRKSFGLEGAPVVLQFRSRPKVSLYSDERR